MGKDLRNDQVVVVLKSWCLEARAAALGAGVVYSITYSHASLPQRPFLLLSFEDEAGKPWRFRYSY
jgi:hypothetical protein